jgi:hypothetical protein
LGAEVVAIQAHQAFQSTRTGRIFANVPAIASLTTLATWSSCSPLSEAVVHVEVLEQAQYTVDRDSVFLIRIIYRARSSNEVTVEDCLDYVLGHNWNFDAALQASQDFKARS